LTVSFEVDSGHRAPRAADAAARRLFALVCDACAGAEDLPARLEAGLRAALSMLADEPGLAYLLTASPGAGADADRHALDAQREWIGRLGALLHDAAASDPRASSVEPSFLPPFLIGGVHFQIARLVLAGEGSDLLRLLPGTLEALLAYYFEPGESIPLAQAALAARD
jgi:hypothetical protein